MASDGAASAFAIRDCNWRDGEAQLRAVRHAVFVVEQRISDELEWDGIDAACRHAIAVDPRDQPIGCGRLLRDGHVGRMAVLAAWRNRGVGSALLRHLVALAGDTGHARVVLNAQTRAMPFYARHGFVAIGDEFVEAGIPHRTMERVLVRP